MQNPQIFSRKRAKGFAQVASIISATLTLVGAVQADVIVDTIGGGPTQSNPLPYGFANGSTFLDSQFKGPHGIALDSFGNLFLADKTNNAVRKITKAGDNANSVTTTYIALPSSSRPVGVAVDGANNLYVLTQTEGRLRKYSPNRSTTNIITSSLVNPTALTLDSETNIFVTQLDGTIKKITQGGTISTITSGLNQPRGIAMLDSGFLAVSDTGNNAIRLVNPINFDNNLFTGGNGAGFNDGIAAVAQFNQPHGLAKAPNGMLVVADRGNHRVRLVNINGSASTLYGVDPFEWNPDYYPGWLDGNQNDAAARDPIAVAVFTNGTVFVTELYYHLLRDVVGGNLTVGGGPGNTNTFVIGPATINPSFGYFPDGTLISVSDTNGVATTIRYTTDGTEPTTNSPAAVNGLIEWRESLRDLTSLRTKVFIGTNSSVTVSGQASPSNEVGIPRDVTAGPGSTVIIPVVVNLRPVDQLRSIQFRVEVSPESGSTPAISDQFRPLLVSSNDFAPIVAPVADGASSATIGVSSYSIGNIRGLTVSAIGPQANYLVKPFAVTAMLAVPVPFDAQEGQTYRIEILSPSGTTNGQQATLPLAPMPARRITVSSRSYLVGDSSPGTWYNAGGFGNEHGDFGDGKLFNADVNNAFYASFGIRVPYDFTDAFDAMDVGRPGRPDVLGGDGTITSYDWQKIYLRSLGLETINWARTSARDFDGRHLQIYQTNGTFTADVNPNITYSESSSEAKGGPQADNNPGSVWLRHAVVSAGTVTNVSPGQVISMPVYVKVTPGYSLAGLQFRATLLPEVIPAIPIQFVNPIGGNFSQQPGVSLNDILCSWAQVPGAAFNPQLQGNNLLGYIQFQVPANASAGQSYKLHFSYTDGAPDLNTQYDFENLSGYAWVQTAALTPSESISEQWKTYFFGNLINPSGDDTADPDEDGASNWQEYLAGTNPTNALSRFQFSNSEWRNAGSRGIALQWLTAPGKTYVMECASSLNSPTWTSIVTNIGDGNTWEFVHTNVNNNAQFYRIRLKP